MFFSLSFSLKSTNKSLDEDLKNYKLICVSRTIQQHFFFFVLKNQVLTMCSFQMLDTSDCFFNCKHGLQFIMKACNLGPSDGRDA